MDTFARVATLSIFFFFLFANREKNLFLVRKFFPIREDRFNNGVRFEDKPQEATKVVSLWKNGGKCTRYMGLWTSAPSEDCSISASAQHNNSLYFWFRAKTNQPAWIYTFSHAAPLKLTYRWETWQPGNFKMIQVIMWSITLWVLAQLKPTGGLLWVSTL